MANRPGTNAEWLHTEAERQGIPVRSLDHVKADLAAAAVRDPEIAKAVAALMLRHGRMTGEARAYVESYLAKQS